MIQSALKTFISARPTTHLNKHVDSCLSLLKYLSGQHSITSGKSLHAYLIKLGTTKERHISVKLLLMYLGTRNFSEANELVKEFQLFDVVVWNCLVHSYVQRGNLEEARKLFDQMPRKNGVTWTILISGCMQHGRVQEAIRYFEKNPFQNVISWTAAISGYMQNGYCFDGLKLFTRLLACGVKPNEITFTSVLRGSSEMGEFLVGFSILSLIVKVGLEESLSICNSLITLLVKAGDTEMARQVFDKMETRDVVSWTAILDLYVEMDLLEDARNIFDQMPERNEVSWSAMITRYNQKGHPQESLNLFCEMIRESLKPNKSCFATILNALSSLDALVFGMSLHGHILKIGIQDDTYISVSLIDFYCKCRETSFGRVVFDSILNKSLVTWNSMIGGYSLNGHLEEAKILFDIMPFRDQISWNAMIVGFLNCKQFYKCFEVFNEMLSNGEVPNNSTFTSMLCACANIPSPQKGNEIHGKIIKLGIVHDIYVDTALTDMYSSCGVIDSSKKIFDRMPEKDSVPWTVMIQGLAESGRGEDAINLFEKMKRTSSVTPTELMLLSVLFACSHSGLVDKGLHYFKSMESDNKLKPSILHYNCMVDMLSRSGRLLEAEELMNRMPFEPHANVFAALLNGCKTYRNQEVLERIAGKVCQLDGKDSAGRYVLLSNIYACLGRWRDVSTLRKLMVNKGWKKTRGCSWIQIKNQAYTFYSGFACVGEIYNILELLRANMSHPE